jgi:ATP-dependent helicase/nuclease subunit A
MSAGEEMPFGISCVSVESLIDKKLEEIIEKTYHYAALRGKTVTVPETLENRFSYEYPYENLKNIPGKVSVSELKKAAMDEETRDLFEEPEVVPYIPDFLREERKGSATERGDAYHRLMECMNLEGIVHSNQVKEQLEQLVASGKMTQLAADTIHPYDIYCFCQSRLCKRMIEAEKKGDLYKEQPFVIAKPASEIDQEYESCQEILVQGIIDAYFEENDGVVLLDYKTDHVKTGEELVKRYKKQLQVYGEALEQMTGKTVKEKVIYSFCLQKEILV